MKLERTTAKRIASLINSYGIWKTQASKAIEEKRHDDYRQYREWANDTMIELYKEFGIELPNLTTVLAERLEKAA